MSNRRENAGRYTRVNDAQHPGPELPRARPQMRIVIAAVPDPMPVLDANGAILPPKRQKVAVNANCDALENEHSRGRISEGAYQAGLAYQMVLEVLRGQRSGGPSFEPRDRGISPQSIAHSLFMKIATTLDAADVVHEVRGVIGQWAECLLSDVLAARITLTQAALARGYTSNDGRRRVAGEFREALEDLAAHWEKSRAPKIGA